MNWPRYSYGFLCWLLRYLSYRARYPISTNLAYPYNYSKCPKFHDQATRMIMDIDTGTRLTTRDRRQINHFGRATCLCAAAFALANRNQNSDLASTKHVSPATLVAVRDGGSGGAFS